MRGLIHDLDRLGVPAAELTADRYMTAVNNHLAELLHLDPDQLAGIDIAQVLANKSQERMDIGLSTSYRFDRTAGTVWYRLDLKAVDDGFVALLIDVSSEPFLALRDYNTTRDKLLADGKIGTWRFDPDAELYYFSSELSLGHEGAGPAVPLKLLQLIQHSDDKDKDTAIRDRLTREGGSANTEMRYREADGSWTHLDVHYRSGRRLPSGRFEMLGISQNITAIAVARDEANQLSERLTGALREADYANRSKTEFLANMSHELRTPLNAILGFSEMIERAMFGPIDAKYADYARDIHRSGHHLLELINDVLDLSKLEAGKLELRKSVVSLRDTIADCITLVRGRAEEGEVVLVDELASDALSLHADQRAVKQILLNLLSNAVKFTPEKGRVTVRSSRDAEDNISLTVIDTGIGMKPADIEVALSPFGQVDSRLTRKHAGTGLGLPICKSLMELHGGDLLVTSEPGIGTTMTAKFPASCSVGTEARDHAGSGTLSKAR